MLTIGRLLSARTEKVGGLGWEDDQFEMPRTEDEGAARGVMTRTLVDKAPTIESESIVNPLKKIDAQSERERKKRERETVSVVPRRPGFPASPF